MKYVILCLLLLVCGCDTTATELGFQTDQIEATITLESGQQVAYVKYDDFGKWIHSHRQIYIDALAPVDRSGHGATNGYIVVFRNERMITNVPAK